MSSQRVLVRYPSGHRAILVGDFLGAGYIDGPGWRRLAAARSAAEASRPTACPNVGCGSDDIWPRFDPSGDWFECGACSWVWEVGR